MARIDYHNIDLVKLDLEVRQMRADAMRHGFRQMGAWLKKSFSFKGLGGHQAA